MRTQQFLPPLWVAISVIVLFCLPDPIFFLYIPAYAADVAAVNPKGIKTPFANGLITFFINGSPVFNNGKEVYQETS